MRISSPPTTHPCMYGIDTPTHEELIASKYSVQEICDYIQADSLAYLSHEGMMRVARADDQGYCSACFTGNYPIHVAWRDELLQLPLFDSAKVNPEP